MWLWRAAIVAYAQQIHPPSTTAESSGAVKEPSPDTLRDATAAIARDEADARIALCKDLYNNEPHWAFEANRAMIDFLMWSENDLLPEYREAVANNNLMHRYSLQQVAIMNIEVRGRSEVQRLEAVAFKTLDTHRASAMDALQRRNTAISQVVDREACTRTALADNATVLHAALLSSCRVGGESLNVRQSLFAARQLVTVDLLLSTVPFHEQATRLAIESTEARRLAALTQHPSALACKAHMQRLATLRGVSVGRLPVLPDQPSGVRCNTASPQPQRMRSLRLPSTASAPAVKQILRPFRLKSGRVDVQRTLLRHSTRNREGYRCIPRTCRICDADKQEESIQWSAIGGALVSLYVAQQQQSRSQRRRVLLHHRTYIVPSHSLQLWIRRLHAGFLARKSLHDAHRKKLRRLRAVYRIQQFFRATQNRRAAKRRLDDLREGRRQQIARDAALQAELRRQRLQHILGVMARAAIASRTVGRRRAMVQHAAQRTLCRFYKRCCALDRLRDRREGRRLRLLARERAEEHASAATILTAWCRQLAAKRVGTMLMGERRRHATQRDETERIGFAAVCIQSVWRRHSQLMVYRRSRLPSSIDHQRVKEAGEERWFAAVRIQTRVRCHLARARTKTLLAARIRTQIESLQSKLRNLGGGVDASGGAPARFSPPRSLVASAVMGGPRAIPQERPNSADARRRRLHEAVLATQRVEGAVETRSNGDPAGPPSLGAGAAGSVAWKRLTRAIKVTRSFSSPLAKTAPPKLVEAKTSADEPPTSPKNAIDSSDVFSLSADVSQVPAVPLAAAEHDGEKTFQSIIAAIRVQPERRRGDAVVSLQSHKPTLSRKYGGGVVHRSTDVLRSVQPSEPLTRTSSPTGRGSPYRSPYNAPVIKRQSSSGRPSRPHSAGPYRGSAGVSSGLSARSHAANLRALVASGRLNVDSSSTAAVAPLTPRGTFGLTPYAWNGDSNGAYRVGPGSSSIGASLRGAVNEAVRKRLGASIV